MHELLPGRAWAHRRTSQRFRLLRGIVIANSFFLILSTISYFFVIGPGVYQSLAQSSQIVCMRICAAGDTACINGSNVCANPPNVTTEAVDAITTTSATGHGTVVSDGGDTVTVRGSVVATSTNPTLSNTVFTATITGTGLFTTEMTGLSEATTYYARAYASNGSGTGYGAVVSFVTLTSSGTGQPGSQGTQGGGSPPPPPVKKTLQDLLIPKHRIQDRAYVVIEEVYDFVTKKKIKIKSNRAENIVDFRRPTFQGTTNVRNALILLTLNSSPHHGTTAADAEGKWQWTVSVPLEIGEHTIDVVAMSPEDNLVTGTSTAAFSVAESVGIPPPPVPEPPQTEPGPGGVGPTETPDEGAGTAIPPEEETPVAPGSTKGAHHYAINVIVLSEPDSISKNGFVDVQTEVQSLHPGFTETLLVTYKVINLDGDVIFTEEKEQEVTTGVINQSRVVSSTPLKPGTYLLEVTVQSHGDTVTSTEIFEVKSYPVIDLPILTLAASDASLGLQRAMSLLAAALLLFSAALGWEYRRLRRDPYQINDEDLLGSGMVR
ncbi:MAG: Ig-like domain-containing protein [Patescibacteria group bacterium]